MASKEEERIKKEIQPILEKVSSEIIKKKPKNVVRIYLLLCYIGIIHV